MIDPTLNWIFEYKFFVTVSIAMTAILLFIFYIPNFEKGTKARRALSFITIVPVLAILGFGFTFNYGYSHSPEDLMLSGKTLCFINSREIISRTGSSDELRLDIIDAETGKEIYRNYIGASGDIVSEQNGNLLYSAEENYYVIETSTGTILKEYEWTELPTIYPPLASGITNMGFEGEQGLKILAKNGNTYYIDPFSGKILDTPFNVSAKPSKKSMASRSDKLNGDSDSAKPWIEFIDKKGSVGSLLTSNSNNVSQNEKSGTVYLYPKFISRGEITVIKSFETTDKKNFLLTGISSDMKQLWQINQKDLEGGETDNGLDHWIIYNDNLIFNLDDKFYSINEKTGVVNWKVLL